jgi:dihydroxyacetone kinase-like protein
VDIAQARAWITAIAVAIAENAERLTELDSAIGDSDHGVNLNRGFTAVVAALDGYEPATVGELFVRTGSTLVSKVGGASGPLYGTAFRAIGKELADSTVDGQALSAALHAGLSGIQKLGGAQPGDKTIVDAYAPALSAFDERLAAGGDLAAASAAAAAAASDGMHATIGLQARKGRASYLGERSVGHQDPGATSTWLIFKALAEVTSG